MPFDKLTALSRDEGLTVLSEVEGLTALSRVEGLTALSRVEGPKRNRNHAKAWFIIRFGMFVFYSILDPPEADSMLGVHLLIQIHMPKRQRSNN